MLKPYLPFIPLKLAMIDSEYKPISRTDLGIKAGTMDLQQTFWRDTSLAGS